MIIIKFAETGTNQTRILRKSCRGRSRFSWLNSLISIYRILKHAIFTAHSRRLQMSNRTPTLIFHLPIFDDWEQTYAKTTDLVLIMHLCTYIHKCIFKTVRMTWPRPNFVDLKSIVIFIIDLSGVFNKRFSIVIAEVDDHSNVKT